MVQFGGGFGTVEKHHRLPLGDGGTILDQDGFDPTGDFGRNVDLGGFDFPLDVVDRGGGQETSGPRAESQDDQSSDHGGNGFPLNPHTLSEHLQPEQAADAFGTTETSVASISGLIEFSTEPAKQYGPLPAQVGQLRHDATNLNRLCRGVSSGSAAASTRRSMAVSTGSISPV